MKGAEERDGGRERGRGADADLLQRGGRASKGNDSQQVNPKKEVHVQCVRFFRI